MSMEFGVAAFSAVLGAAMTKLSLVQSKKLQSDATIIKERLGRIEATLQEYASKGRDFGPLQKQWIAQRRRLAYDIEDRVDSFHAKKTTLRDFRREITQLMGRFDTMNEDIGALAAEQTVMLPVAQGTPEVGIPTNPQDVSGDNHNCLLVYLCLFPLHHPVRTKPLMRRWLAEGLVRTEELAVKNLEDLTNSNDIISIKRSNNGKVRRCEPTAEKLVDISQTSTSEMFILFCDSELQLQKEEAHRLSVHPSANVQRNLPDRLPRLRTLAVFPDTAGASASGTGYEDVLDFARYEVLRVLDLKECAHLSGGHIQAICKQVLMKYLSMNPGSIDRIERKIGHLEQLETLDLSGSEPSHTVTVYKEVLLLPKLKHLLGRFQLSRTDTFIDTYIPRWLVKSRLHKFFTEKNKSKLETLAGFVINDKPGFPQLMILMRLLRKVKIWCESDASPGNLSDISRAITKFIRDGAGRPDLGLSLSIDFQACSGDFVNNIDTEADGGILGSLKLRGKLELANPGIFPPFVARLSSVTELCLVSTGLSWEVIREGLMTGEKGLKYLKLVEDDLGPINILSDHLKSIERICIECVCNTIHEIAIQAGALPHLVSLCILCKKLNVMPGTSGIEITHMEKLKEIALHDNLAGGIRTQLEQAVAGHDNVPVPVLTFLAP